jgi:hypothetical protein
MELFDKSKFATKKELFKFLVENKASLIAQKKATMKRADGISASINSIPSIRKTATSDSDVIQVKAIINTTNVLDSHDDVHIPGIWNKTLKDNTRILHLQEHQLQFDKIIADGPDLDVSVNDVTFVELGYDYDMRTEALTFDSTVKKERNAFMFGEYKSGHVDNHSVGMIYVKLQLAINDEEEAQEFEVWNKYIDEIANKDDAVNQGYFWAILEAKLIEGSAVPIGSNTITPTLEVKKPTGVTSKIFEPPVGTQKTISNYLLT